jgi:hypothetical protein
MLWTVVQSDARLIGVARTIVQMCLATTLARVLTALLCLAAFVAGLTGAWSPCGFSMVATIGEHGGSRRLKLFACAAFVPGALAGGALTFGVLALAGSLLGGGSVAVAVAAVLAGAGALAEATGMRIAPQIRRQVPEHWRRTWPLPLAVGAYGVLLGLGFTTFVLTFAVPALAGVALALGDVTAGLLMGLAFGAGRALPVVVLAPFATAPLGYRATELMAERPGVLRGFRTADALALGACCVALAAGGAPAFAQSAAVEELAAPASDPSATLDAVAWALPGGTSGVLARGDTRTPVGGGRPAVGGSLLAWIAGDEVRVTRRDTGEPVLTLPARGADAVAVSDRWLVLRRTGATQRLLAIELRPAATVRVVASVRPPAQLGRPALDGDRLVFHVAGPRASRIDELDLATGVRRTLRGGTRSLVTNPSLLGARLLFVETTPYSQALRLGPRIGRGGQVLLRIAPAIEADKGYSTDHGPHRPSTAPRRPAKEGPRGTTTTLWTTALAPDAAYVTRLRESPRGTTDAAILRILR